VSILLRQTVPHFYYREISNFFITATDKFVGHPYHKTVKGKSVPLQAWTGPEGS